MRRALLAMLLASPLAAEAQPSPYNSEAPSPCPVVLIEQKYDHVSSQRYRNYGWDTVIFCDHQPMYLTANPYIPVQQFNGTYVVERVPYNPPDPSYWLNPETIVTQVRQRVPATADDTWAPSVTIPNDLFFYFFGIRKTKFTAGTNGIMTFANGASGGCSYTVTDPIPWSSTNPPSQWPGQNYYRDAIYGVYEDTDPGSSGAALSGNQGIWYGIIGEWPCRKLIVSFYELPWYPYGSNTSNRQTYQIVCYEGTNIIEVHIKRRRRGLTDCNWCNYGLIGIQNATGDPQVRNSDYSASNGSAEITGKPAAFWPVLPDGTSCNTLTNQQLDTISFRFTPQGTTQKSIKWMRILDDGTSVELGTDPADTNGYCENLNTNTVTPNLQAWVNPTVPSRYAVQITYTNPGGQTVNVTDTIFIGMDTSDSLLLDAVCGNRVAGNDRVFNVCQGQTVECPLRYTDVQQPKEIHWNIKRIYNGVPQELPNTMIVHSADSTSVTINPDPQFDTMDENKIDSILLIAAVEFTNHCSGYDSLLVCFYPNFDQTEVYGICQGESLTWNGNTYYQSTDPRNEVLHLHSLPGCDSTVRLDLTVFPVTHVDEPHMDCKPYTWRNGVTYYRSNTATYAVDTIMDTNRYGCDSIVHLVFTYHPLTARIKSSLEFFDYENMEATLSDVSIGGGDRRWLLPYGLDASEPEIVYTIPDDLDTADIRLIALSPYGCQDTTLLRIPFYKETFWLPNIFTPNDPDGHNTTFGSTSTNTLEQEMFIYDRQGQMVFQCTGVDCRWDGRRDDGSECPQGAYVYLIRYHDRYQPLITKLRRGTVTLVR